MACIASLWAGPSAAQAPGYPTQSIRLIVPFTPGTGMDTIARAVAPRLGERLGQPVVVQNQPGASGNIGADAVAKAAPDGHTLLMGANTMLIAAQLYRNVPFDPLKDFAPVSMAAWGTLMLVAHPKAGLRSAADLLARARERPGMVTYGSPGVGTPHHMAMELLRTQARLTLLHVPYKGTAGYVTDLVAGEIMTGFLPVHVAQGLVQNGKLLALAVGGARRHAAAPGVPTLDELGQPGVDVDMWYAFFTPARTPAAVVARLNGEIGAILREPEVRGVLSKAGLDAASSSSDELAALMQRDHPRWGEVIRRNGIRAD